MVVNTSFLNSLSDCSQGMAMIYNVMCWAKQNGALDL
jgi:hypothetical protein